MDETLQNVSLLYRLAESFDTLLSSAIGAASGFDEVHTLSSLTHTHPPPAKMSEFRRTTCKLVSMVVLFYMLVATEAISVTVSIGRTSCEGAAVISTDSVAAQQSA